MSVKRWKRLEGSSEEIWVSECGDVCREIRRKAHMSMEMVDVYGVWMVRMVGSKDRLGNIRIRIPGIGWCRVGRLVGELYCEKASGCDYIIYRDGDRSNNRWDNLEWVDKSGSYVDRKAVRIEVGEFIEDFDNIDILMNKYEIPYGTVKYGLRSGKRLRKYGDMLITYK